MRFPNDFIGRIGATIAVSLAVVGCDDFITVENPNVVETSSIDPVEDGPMLARSAFQDFTQAFGNVVLYGAWFTTEAWAGDSSEDVNQFGRRAVDPTNGRLNGTVWPDLARGLATSEEVIGILSDAPNADANVNLARASLSAGYSLQLMSELFCTGTMLGGPELSTAEMIDLATSRFEDAARIADAAGGDEAEELENAALAGLARSHLQAGRDADAADAAAQVADGFEMLLHNIDDQSNRDRLGNQLYEATDDRAGLVVPPVYRAMADAGDPRITYEDYGVLAYDGYLTMYAQKKYTGWASPYRLASKLEARYIEVEARGDADEMLEFINERRAVGGQDPYDSLTADELLPALMAQKSRDFWLEGQRMGDLRRNGDAVPNVIQADAEYYKPASGPVRGEMCVPLPISETDNNPNF